MDFVDVLGPTLRGSDGKATPTDTEVAGMDAVALYFSAHWCPPCRGFTPKLAEIYKDITSSGKKFKIIFVSSDRDETSYNEYHNEMPWPALPFSESKRKADLSKTFKISGIPALIILDGHGNTITSNGREEVMDDPKGDRFPWPQPTLDDLVEQAVVVDKAGNEAPLASLKGMHVGLYFSAAWCPPCQKFSPLLAEVYQKVKDKQSFEIVYISSDRDQDAFDGYYGKMPWRALKFSDRQSKQALSKFYEVEGIPTFVMLNPDFTTLNSNARGDVTADLDGTDFPWAPKAVNSLSSPDGINDTASVVVLMEKADSDTKAHAKAALTAVAEKVNTEAKEAGKPCKFAFYYGDDASDSVTGRVRQLMEAGPASDKLQVFLLDIPDNGGFYKVSDDEVTEFSLSQLLVDYSAGKLTRHQLKN